MQKREERKIMNDKPPKHLWPLSRRHHKCKVKMTSLVTISINLKKKYVPDII